MHLTMVHNTTKHREIWRLWDMNLKYFTTLSRDFNDYLRFCVTRFSGFLNEVLTDVLPLKEKVCCIEYVKNLSSGQAAQ